MKILSILGCTGSIGRQTLDVARSHPEDFKIAALAAGGNSLELLAQQIELFSPELVSVPEPQHAKQLQQLLAGKPIEILHGMEGLESAASYHTVTHVVSAVVGSLGIRPTATALQAGKIIALANKETLVAAGCAIMPLSKQYKAQIIPVDSEHSAIHQALSHYQSKDIKQILLTGSGGPFRTWTKNQIASATIDDALQHPNWSMGPKITIDSATLMNKGLEIIEARWLFDISPEKICVVIHPQSILHSAVEFVDGSVVGQLGLPDMHLPIHYALCYPDRKPSLHVPTLDLFKVRSLTFEEPDLERFPCLALAAEIARREDSSACVLNAANEIAVQAFLKGHISFPKIAKFIYKVVDLHQSIKKPSLDDILEADLWARQMTHELLGAPVT